MVWWTIFDIEEKEKKLKELEANSAKPNFWNDRENATKIQEEISGIKEDIETIADEIIPQLEKITAS